MQNKKEKQTLKTSSIIKTFIREFALLNLEMAQRRAYDGQTLREMRENALFLIKLIKGHY